MIFDLNWKKPKRKYQKENQGWIIKFPTGRMWNGTFSSRRQGAQAMVGECWGGDTWKQLYAKGYRAVKVEVTEIEEWG